jgi:hypothetical protein
MPLRNLNRRLLTELKRASIRILCLSRLSRATLFEKTGTADTLDEACLKLDGSKSINDFITAFRKLRFWKREDTISF